MPMTIHAQTLERQRLLDYSVKWQKQMNYQNFDRSFMQLRQLGAIANNGQAS